MLDSLIKVLQYTVDNTKEFVGVRDEVAFIHNYIRILNFRYFERFSFIFDIKEDTLEYEMPRFILQPLVENAVLHGFDNNDLNATVKLSIHLQDGDLFLCVSDDGRGMPEEKIREILHTDSSSKKSLNKIGLYNVNQRICLTYGEKYAVHIDSPKGIVASVMEGLSLGCGDAVIGLNPVDDSVESVARILKMFDEFKNKWEVPTQICLILPVSLFSLTASHAG